MSWLLEKFKTFGNKTAIIWNNKEYSYKNLYDKIQEFETLLEKDIKKGEVIAILGDYSFENIALFFYLYKNKNIIVPIISDKESEIKEKLKESYSDKALKINNGNIKIDTFPQTEKHNLIENLRQSQNAGLILFSSGSTGKPKAMLHNLDKMVDIYKNRKEKNINSLVFLTFDHIGGIDTLLRLLSIGGTITIPDDRTPETVSKYIEKYKVEVLPTTPTFLNLLLISGVYHKYDLSSLKIIAYGAEPMPENLLKKLKEIFPNVEFQQKFGTSETNAIKVKNKKDNELFLKIEDENIQYKIVDGELWIKSKTQVLGYLNAPMDSFTKDGWFKTGDLVEKTKDGYIRIIGRKKEVINVGGEKVLPSEVEAVILELPSVLDCMVYGEENPITGQMVVADVIINDDIDQKEAKKLIRKHCREKLDNYKVPTKINFVDKVNFGDRFKKIRRK
ncbi:MAG: long-chain fatty acid--CoA ligase [Aquificae bacterium]|nr:long-chain fatty acid--CoA ligase [Aquificota bacterium]